MADALVFLMRHGVTRAQWLFCPPPGLTFKNSSFANRVYCVCYGCQNKRYAAVSEGVPKTETEFTLRGTKLILYTI
jgi:hypothetical protein